MTEWELRRSFESAEGTIRWDCFGEGRPIVLLHGTPNWSFIWRNVVPILAELWQVYVFDWPGFGTSERFEGQNISWDEQPRRLVELIEYWNLDQPAIVAFDFAPIFALRAHFFEGLDIGALVLADAAVIPPFVTEFSRQARDNIGAFRQLPAHITEGMVQAHMEKTTLYPMPTKVLEAYMQPWRGKEGTQAYWRAVACYDEHMAQPLVSRLKNFEPDTLVLWGEKDEWLPPAMGRTLADAMPNAQLRYVENAGHFAQEDNPGGFAKAVASFLEERGH